MTIADELQKLDELRRNGVISNDEFERAKTKVLETSQDAILSDQLESIKLQNELTESDRQWELERETYMVRGKYGHQHIPEKSSSALRGVFVVAFGVFWTVSAATYTGFGRGGVSSVFPLFGVLFILFGASISFSAFIKAGQYEQAQQMYQRRRRELQSKNRTT